MKKNNNGFTLVEIMVAVTILSLISIMLFSFIGFGTVGYTRTNNRVNLQKESQATMNQLTEMLIDATNGVTYSVNGTVVDSDENFHIATDAAVSTKTVCIFNKVQGAAGTDQFVETMIKWEDSTKQIIFEEYEIEKDDATGNYSTGTQLSHSIMAENVDKFVVDLSKISLNNTVTIELGFSIKDAEFEAKKTITLRNNILVNKGLNQTFEVKNMVLNPTVENVILNPSTVYVEQGSSYDAFQVTVVGENNPGQDCNWTIVNKADLTDASGTAIDKATGKLKISPKETCAAIQIKATSNVSETLNEGNPDAYKYDTATVLNKYISGMSITDVKSGANLKATATININGVNFQGNEDYSSDMVVEVFDGDTKLPEPKVKIVSVEKTASDAVFMTSSYEVVITGSEAYVNKTLTLKVSVDNGISTTKSAETTFEFKKPQLMAIRLEEPAVGGIKPPQYLNGEERKAKRGETIDFYVVAVYGYGDGQEEEKKITSADEEWGLIDWSTVYAAGATTHKGVTNNLDGEGNIDISDSSQYFGYSSKYDFTVKAKYRGLEASVKIILPEVQLKILNYPEKQYRQGIVVGGDGSYYPATIQFDVEGLIPSGNMIQMSWYVPEGLNVNRVQGKNEFTVYATETGKDYSLTFYLKNNTSIQTTLQISANDANVRNGNNILPYYVPPKSDNATFFTESVKEYRDLYGNVFLYEKDGVMTFNGDTYNYKNYGKKKYWVKQ